MDKTRIAIFGANGQLGKALQRTFPNATCLSREDFDISSKDTYSTFDWSKYDVLINSAAMTNVDGAETPEGRRDAWLLNATAVGYMAEAATEHELTLVHISSDYVFDGVQSIHTEDEDYTPLGVYGQSKAAGDIAASATPKHYIVRTSWVIGEGNNFVRTMYSLAERGIKPSVVDDQIGRMSFTDDIASAIAHILHTNTPHGIYNVSNDGDAVSWADIAKEVYTLQGSSADDVTPVTTDEYYTGKEEIAPRPLQSTLSLDKIKATGFSPSDWRHALKDYLSN